MSLLPNRVIVSWLLVVLILSACQPIALTETSTQLPATTAVAATAASPTAASPLPPVWLNTVWGSSGSDVYVVGNEGRILHYDGIAWSPMESGTTNNLSAVWGNAADAVFVVGDDGMILRYDGADWSPMVSGTSNHLPPCGALRRMTSSSVARGARSFTTTAAPGQQ